MKHLTYFIFLCFLVSCQTKTDSNTKTKIDIELVKVKEIKLEESDNPIGIVSSVKIDKDSILYLLDISASDVKMYDLQGRFIKRIGGKGKGPNQLLSPRNFCITEKFVIVGDLGNYTIKFFSKENSQLYKTLNLKKYRPVFGETLLFENKIITTGLWDGERNYDDAVIMMDTSGIFLKSIGEYPPEYPEYQKLDATTFIDINSKGDMLICFIQSPSISIVNLLNGFSKKENFESMRNLYVSEKYKQDMLTIEDFQKINLSIFYNTCIRFLNDTLIVRGVAKHNEKSSSQGSFVNALNACEIYSEQFEMIGKSSVKGVMRDVFNGLILIEECDDPNNRIYSFYEARITQKK